jgi:hypothetical protein
MTAQKEEVNHGININRNNAAGHWAANCRRQTPESLKRNYTWPAVPGSDP